MKKRHRNQQDHERPVKEVSTVLEVEEVKMTVTNQFNTSEQQPKPAKKDWATLYNQASSQIGKLIERQSHQL